MIPNPEQIPKNWPRNDPKPEMIPLFFEMIPVNLRNDDKTWDCGSLFTSYIVFPIYYMAVSHKDWELPNLRIWLAEIDVESGLDFPI